MPLGRVEVELGKLTLLNALSVMKFPFEVSKIVHLKLYDSSFVLTVNQICFFGMSPYLRDIREV